MDPVLASLIESPVAATILVITVITSMRAFKEPALMEKFLFIPTRVYHDKEYSRLFTSGLIHANTPHLAFNMITFFFFAFTLYKRDYFYKYYAPIIVNLITPFKHLWRESIKIKQTYLHDICLELYCYLYK